MPIYEYICEDCNIIWEDWKDSIPKKLQKKKK